MKKEFLLSVLLLLLALVIAAPAQFATNVPGAIAPTNYFGTNQIRGTNVSSAFSTNTIVPFAYPAPAYRVAPVVAAIGDSITTSNTGGLNWPSYWETFTNINQQGHLSLNTNYIRYAFTGISVVSLNTNYPSYVLHTQRPTNGQAGFAVLETGQNDHGVTTNLFIYSYSNLVAQLHADGYKVVAMLQWSNSWYNGIITTNTAAENNWVLAQTNIDFVFRSDLLFLTNQSLLTVGPHPVAWAAMMLATNLNNLLTPQMTSFGPPVSFPPTNTWGPARPGHLTPDTLFTGSVGTLTQTFWANTNVIWLTGSTTNAANGAYLYRGSGFYTNSAGYTLDYLNFSTDGYADGIIEGGYANGAFYMAATPVWPASSDLFYNDSGTGSPGTISYGTNVVIH